MNQSTLLILVVIIAVAVLYYTNKQTNQMITEPLIVDKNKICTTCGDKTRNECSDCSNCGYCINRGTGECKEGNKNGPMSDKNCDTWLYDDYSVVNHPTYVVNTIPLYDASWNNTYDWPRYYGGYRRHNRYNRRPHRNHH